MILIASGYPEAIFYLTYESAIYLEEGGKAQKPETDRTGFPGGEEFFPVPVQGYFFAAAGGRKCSGDR